MKKILISSLAVMLLTMSPFGQASWAAKAYIVDTKDVPLRSGPSVNNRTLLNIPSGSPVEVLKSNEYARIQYTDPSGQTKEGWVPAMSLGARPPESALTKELQGENAGLQERLMMVEREKNELIQRERNSTEKLAALQREFESLKSGSTNYLKFKEEYDSVKGALASAQENIQSLLQENESLKASQWIMWFGAGAMVLLAGWFIGWLTGRRQKKRRSTYFF